MKKHFLPVVLPAICVILSALIILSCIAQCRRAIDSEVVVFSSSADGDRLKRTKGNPFITDRDLPLPVITVDTAVRFQKIDGFGASFNEAGMICLNSLSRESKDSVLRMLFDKESGAGFSLMKSPIGACDFASAGPWYTYNEVSGDTAMNHFSIERDLRPDGLVTFIKEAMKYGEFQIESPMDFAPDWMYFGLKDGEKHIRPEYYSALAKYYSKYIQAYAGNGVTINYLNLFNEPDHPHYSNVTYQEIGHIIKDYVVPRFKADGISTRIQLGETCVRGEALEKFPAILSDPEIRNHIHAVTVHGYDWKDFAKLTEFHNKFPDIPVWMTEICYATMCCIPENGPAKVPVYEFSDGEFWGNMIMNDLKNYVSGWIYWNMILDQNGGPWLVSPEHGDPDNNPQHSVVIINRAAGKVTYTGLYYYLAHFSRFIRPGAYRINSSGGIDKLNFAAFRNTDGTIVLNVINNSDEIKCKIKWYNKMTTQKFKAHSITTIIWNQEDGL